MDSLRSQILADRTEFALNCETPQRLQPKTRKKRFTPTQRILIFNKYGIIKSYQKTATNLGPDYTKLSIASFSQHVKKHDTIDMLKTPGWPNISTPEQDKNMAKEIQQNSQKLIDEVRSNRLPYDCRCTVINCLKKKNLQNFCSSS